MDDQTKLHNVVFYLRASTKKQPVERQKADLTRYAAAMGWNIIDIFPENESGLLDAKDRPELTRLLEFVKNPANGITCVAVHELSRLGRNKDVLNVVSELTAAGINLFARKESLNTFNEDGTKNGTAKMVIGILSAINENEVDTAAYRFSSGKKYWASQGAVAGGFIPVGYKSSEDIKHRVLLKDPIGVELVERVFEMYLRGGRGCRQIAAVFNDEGIPTQQGEKRNNIWLQTSIRSILMQSLYIGKRKHKGETFDLPHLRIISDEDFNAAQKKLTDHSFKQTVGNKHEYLLDKKIITCGVCGKPYYARNNHSSKTYVYSCATTRSMAGSCGNIGINIKKLDAAVYYNIEKYFPQQVLEQLDYQYFVQQIQIKKNQIINLELEQELFESKLERLNDIYAAGGSTKEKWQEKRKVVELANVRSSLDQTKLSAEITTMEYQMNEPRYAELTKDVIHKVVQSITIERGYEREATLTVKGDKAVKVSMIVRGSEFSFYLSHFSNINEQVTL